MNKYLPQNIDALVLDFDGVFTDNKVIVFENGQEAVVCDRSDSYGLERIKKSGVQVMVLSGEKNNIVKVRCKKLNIPCIIGISDKKGALLKWAKKRKINLKNTIYVGNDVNDLECLKSVGYGVVVADAYPEAKAAASLILKSIGGNGAVREILQMVIAHLGLK